MGKNIKIILISLFGLAVLGGTILLLQLTKPQDSGGEPDVAEPEKPSFIFTDFEREPVLSISVVNQRDDGYTIEPNPLADDDHFLIPELEERSKTVPYNQELLETAVTAVKKLSSDNLVEENAEDLGKYGLLEPIAAVEAQFGDGSGVAFTVGDATPDETTYYFCLKGENAVYTMATQSVNPFFRERHEWLEKLAFPQYNAAETPTIDNVKIERSDLDEPIVIEAIPKLPLEELRTFNSHRLVSPFRLDADPEKSTSVIYGLFGLNAAHVLWVAPDEVDYELTGLNEPRCTVEVTVGGETHVLTIGDDYEGDFYGKGVYGTSSYVPELVFMFNPSDVPWLTVNPEDLVSDIFLTPYIYSLDRFTVECGGDVLEFTVTGDEEDNTVLYNGEELKGASRERFLGLYQFLISARGENLFLEETEDSETIAKITFIYRDGSRESDTVEYLKGDNRQSVIRVNGANIFTCRDVYTARLVQNVEAFINKQEIISDW